MLINSIDWLIHGGWSWLGTSIWRDPVWLHYSLAMESPLKMNLEPPWPLEQRENPGISQEPAESLSYLHLAMHLHSEVPWRPVMAISRRKNTNSCGILRWVNLPGPSTNALLPQPPRMMGHPSYFSLDEVLDGGAHVHWLKHQSQGHGRYV